MTDTILVTGATGTIGSEVVRQLASEGAIVRAGVHSHSKFDKIKGPIVGVCSMDYDDPSIVKAALKNVKKLFLLTPLDENMVKQTVLLVDEAKKAGVKYIVKISAVGADEKAPFNLLRWHREAEKIIENSRISYTNIRPNVFMQNFVNFYAKDIKEKNGIFSPAGNAKIGFVDTRDIAAVATRALLDEKHNGKTYEITGPEAISYDKAAEILSKVAGKKIGYSDISNDTVKKHLEGQGMPDWMVEAFVGLGKMTREGKFSLVTDNVEKITGKKARSFKEFAEDHAIHFK